MMDIGKLLAPYVRRLSNMLARGTVAVVNSASKMQGLQIRLLAGEVKDAVEHFEPYGFTSNPNPGAEGVTLFFDGDRSHGLVVVVADRRYRMTGFETGEVAIHDDQGQYVHLKRNGILTHSPLNIYLRTDGVLRLEGEGVEIHGRSYVQQDVHGKGQRETWQGGNAWHVDSYTTPATGTATEHGLDQPHVPTDHPEGP